MVTDDYRQVMRGWQRHEEAKRADEISRAADEEWAVRKQRTGKIDKIAFTGAWKVEITVKFPTGDTVLFLTDLGSFSRDHKLRLGEPMTVDGIGRKLSEIPF